MNRLFPRCALLALAAACAASAVARDRADDPPEGGASGRGALHGYANPSAAIAAELALDRDGAARGTWTALAATAAPEAVVFSPKLVWARDAFKGRANSALPRRWQVGAVWSSCDGSLVVARGSFREGEGREGEGRAGWFARVWQRQGDGRYKWLASATGAQPHADAEPDMIAAAVADCPTRPARADGDGSHQPGKAPLPKHREPAPLDPLLRAGAAADGTLRWTARVDPDGTPRLTAIWRKDGTEQTLLDERPPTGGS
ncbi:hypothetical protein ACFOD9_11445 [Novosphingobium bradum]|uniref:DUF4440 domain-containing protein n=1 Tax=Novosphingobium bradum TaxID=1737444 RepID=A0ABV7IVW9_9SPHN